MKLSCTHWKNVADATKTNEEIMKETRAKKQKSERSNATKLVSGCRKIRLYPNEEDRNKLEQWFRVYGWTYNQAQEAIKFKKIKPTKTYLRAYYMNR